MTTLAAPPRSPLAKFAALAGCLVLAFIAAGVGAAASVDAQGFYAELTRPSWTPPPWLFGPVWSVLFTMMAVAAWLVWRAGPSPQVRRALWLWGVQLVANALWSWLFFAWRMGAAASVEVLVLLALIVATTLAFRRIRPLAAALMLPYIAWVAFASALTWTLWRMNPALLGS